MNNELRPLFWSDNHLKCLDQRKLPNQEVYVNIYNILDGVKVIKDMVVRGAPLISFTALFSIAAEIKNNTKYNINDFYNDIILLKNSRPTAINLKYELEMLENNLKRNILDFSFEAILKYAYQQIEILNSSNLNMSKLFFNSICLNSKKQKFNILTICNTGRLACGCHGTALGVIDYLNEKKCLNHVFVLETRPFLQGSRLTAYELTHSNIDYSIITEGSLSYIFENNEIDFVIFGADRIALNGDTLNKIGSSTLSIIANYYKTDVHIIAPLSSFDLSLQKGEDVEIEIRSSDEITKFNNHWIAPKSARAINPSFDITHSSLIKSITNQNGIISPVNSKNLENVCKR